MNTRPLNGAIRTSDEHVVIVGGGIAGLSAAWYLHLTDRISTRFSGRGVSRTDSGALLIHRRRLNPNLRWLVREDS